MHNSYINVNYVWTKTLPAALNLLVHWEEGKSPPAQKYESREGVALRTKDNTGGFRGDC